MTRHGCVTHELDLDNPPPLSAEQEAELARLAAMPEAAIDYTDAPPADDTGWMTRVEARRLREKLRRAAE